MKHMNAKRFAASAMAGALSLSMAAPVFAANTTVIEGAYEEIPIAVVVPETGTAQINPYGLPVAVYKSDETSVNIVSQKITNVPLSIRNQGDVALDVNATLAVLPRGGLTIKGAALAAATDKGKQANVTLEVAELNAATYATAFESATLEDAIIDAFADDDTWFGLTATNKLVAPAAAANATTVTPAKSGAALATIGAADLSDADAPVYGNDSIALFRLAGELNAEPVTSDTTPAEDPWTADDGFTATVVFKFTPNTTAATPATPSVSASMSGTPAASGSVTLTATPANIDASKNPTYSWAVTTDTDSIVDSFTDSTAATQTVNIASTATSGQSATLTVTVTYDDTGSQDATVTDTVTITMP